MAGDLTAATQAEVTPVEIYEQFTGPVNAAVTAGQLVGLTTGGLWTPARATTGPVLPKGIAITSATLQYQTITVVSKGLIDVGDILGDLDCGADVFCSNTAGRMADTVVSALAAIGYVAPAWGYTTVDKLLRIDL